METLAFLSSLMFLAVFVTLFWFDRAKRNEAAVSRDDQGETRNHTHPR